MKLVVAIVRPEKLADVLESLFRAEVRGLTIHRVQGHGGETEQVETYRGTTVKMELSDKIRLEIGVSDHFVEPTVDAILRRDYPIIQGVILIFSGAYVLINLAVDLSYMVFDPRIRY